MTTNLEATYPELFEAARFYRDKAVAAGGTPAEVRLRCIIDSCGNVIAGKEPPPDPAHWVQIELSGPRPCDPKPAPPGPTGYRGRRR